MSKKIQQKQNGIRKPSYEELREGVLLDELKARHWKAQWETAYYHLEFEKILPEYRALLEQKEAEARQKMEEQLKEMMEKSQPMEDVEVTEEMLRLNPEMVEQGIKVGETIQLPKKSDLTPEEEEKAGKDFQKEHPEYFDPTESLKAV